MTWDDVVAIALRLPEVEVGSAYGTPALRVGGTFMCRLREDGETLAVRRKVLDAYRAERDAAR